MTAPPHIRRRTPTEILGRCSARLVEIHDATRDGITRDQRGALLSLAITLDLLTEQLKEQP